MLEPDSDVGPTSWRRTVTKLRGVPRRLWRRTAAPPVGEVADAGAVERVAQLIARGRLRKARALTEDVAARPGSEVAADVCRALLAVNGSMSPVAWTLLRRHDAPVVLRLAPLALVRAGLVDDEATTRVLITQAVDEPAWSPAADDVLGIAHAFLMRGDLETAEAVLGRFRDQLERARPRRYATLDAWLRAAQEAPRDNHVTEASIALWDHQDLHPARSPRSIAPYVDTLGLVVALCRTDARLRSDDVAVQSTCDEVAERLGAGRRLGRGVARLHVVPRQASHLVKVPAGTWALVSGPLVRRARDDEARFPYEPRILPVFTGVHVDAEVLGRPGAADYLRENGPVGCADWNSVFLLRAAEVPAFFSGPLTTTLGALAPTASTPAPGPDEEERTVTWTDADAPSRSFGDNLAAALTAVDDLAALGGSPQVVTAESAAYWVARSLGMHARLRAGRKSPVRDDELDVPDARLGELTSATEQRMHVVLSAVLAGEPEQEVRSRWREACAPAVAEAEQRARSLPALEALSWSVEELCADIRSRSVVRERQVEVPGEEVLVEVSLDGRLKHQLGVVLDSIVGHTASPVRVHVLCREHDDRDFTRMADLFPEVSFVWLPTDTATYGDIGGLLTHITVASMDRLLLPSLLPDESRIIHHDLDAVSRGDLAELFALDLDGAPLAARDQLQPHGGSLYRSFAAQAERRFRDHPELGSELILRLSELHPFDHPAFNSGVMVMDLVRMRADSFLERFLPWVARYGLNDQVLLNAYAGSTRAHLPYEWNHYPRIEVPLEDPKIVHWIGSQKPWAVTRTAGRSHWLAAEASFAQRLRRTQ